MLITEGELSWPLLPDDSIPTNLPNPQPTQDQWDAAQAAAAEWLWACSGRQYGTRPAVYRPQSLYIDPRGWYAMIPWLQSIYGPLWGDWSTRPNQDPPQVLQLPGPVIDVTAVVLVDGDGVSTTLDPTKYRTDGDYLVRVDGERWPTTQDMISTMGAANTWSVSYERGRAVPAGGQVAARLLAVEWLKSILGIKDCKLPWNTTMATRSGVSVQLQLANAYRTSGIAAVDRWVTMVNPNALVQPPRVWSPDTARNAQPYRGSAAAYRPTS